MVYPSGEVETTIRAAHGDSLELFRMVYPSGEVETPIRPCNRPAKPRSGWFIHPGKLKHVVNAQELLDRKLLNTAMIYTLVLHHSPLGVRRPTDLV